MLKDEKVINIASLKGIYEKQLNDSDINALFFGLLRLIKKQALNEVSKELKHDFYEASENFKQTLVDLNKTEILLKKEQEKNFELQNKLEKEQEKYIIFNSLGAE